MPLVLGRDVGQKCVITVPPSRTETRITITLTENAFKQSDKSLAFDAPRYVRIDRAEVDDSRAAMASISATPIVARPRATSS